MKTGGTMQDDVLRLAAEAAIDYRSAPAPGFDEVASFEQVLRTLDQPLPENPTDAGEVITELVSKMTPGLRAMTSPTFFGWVIGGSHPTGVAADWLTSAWGQNSGNVVITPASAAAEQVVSTWLLDLLGLPATASVGFVTGATIANFVALAAARGELLRRVGWDVERQGLFGAPVIEVMIGAEAHATVFSGLRYLGLGSERVKTIEADEMGRMKPDALKAAFRSIDGPAIVIAQAGQINTGACDPFPEICSIAHDHGAWVHVDGAFGLWAQASPRFRHLTQGVELADSWATDGHKWLQLPYDSGFAIVKDRAAHERCMSIEASYLPSAEDKIREPSAYVPELSRRARGFAAWAVIRALGRSGITEMIERHCDFAAALGKTCASIPGVRVVAPIELNQLMLRFGESDEATLATVGEIRRRGRIVVGPALWRGEWIMRVSVCNFATGPEQLAEVEGEIASAWETLQPRLSEGSRNRAIAAG
ncbi:MAG TPA: aminotransferase class V-fold PLP-dependent enzyme [Sphingomicrobium sp.]